MSEADVKKPCTVEIEERFRAPILAGATHVGMSIMEYDTHATGYVKAVGTEEECANAHVTQLVVVPIGCTPSYVIMPASDFLPLIEADAKQVQP